MTTLLQKIRAIWDEIQKPICKHKWRPALLNNTPVRHCTQCNTTEPLTDAEFYAQFGKMPHKIDWQPGKEGKR